MTQGYQKQQLDSCHSLGAISLRAIVLAIVRANLRWRRLEEFRAESRRNVAEWSRLDLGLRTRILDALDQAIAELARWTEKHVQIFPEEENQQVRKAAFRQKAQSLDTCRQRESQLYRPLKKALRVLDPSEYLRTFYDCILWRPATLKIDDYATAVRIVEVQCKDWAQMKFQFACCYAMDDLLQDECVFDKNRRRAFKKKLDSHPVYHFWLRVLDDPQEWTRMYRPDRVIVDQKLMLVLRFAITNGFLELVKRLWNGLLEPQMENIGFLCWKKICFSVLHPEMVKFLCRALCAINPKAMIRLSWDNFYYKVVQTFESVEISREEQLERFNKLECLLENWCDPLRKAILSKENFRVFTDSVYHNSQEPFLLFLDYLDGSKHLLNGARQEVDRILERKKGNEKIRFFRQQLVRRWQTVAD